jgi:RNA recognition motif-containing protein
MVLTKVFVGNLSFKTKESELSDEFGAIGKVVTANIITRGNRSLGYGFVEFENEQDAQAALQALNKKSINGREINVELATPRQEGAPRTSPQRRGGFRGGFRGGRGRGGSPNNRADSPQENVQNSPSANQEREGDFNQSPRGRGGRGGRRGGGRGGRGGFRRPSNNNNNNNNNNAPRSPNPNRIESPTSLFVANLPYSFTDDDLKALLPKATRATVAKNFHGKSKGFGFIEFANVEDQQAAFTHAAGVKAQDRELIVKIALVNEDRKSPASPAPTQETA